MDAFGNVTERLLQNGYRQYHYYTTDTGQLTEIKTGLLSGLLAVQQIEFEFDVLGNLIKRHNTGGGTASGNDVEESFCYDALNRLVATATDGALCSASNPDISYDSHGNITHKAGVGSYSYGANGAGPHAVTSAGGNTYNYDANGNMTSDSLGRTITYSPFDKAVRIEKSVDEWVSFAYGTDRRRYQRVDSTASGTTTTWYLGSVEKVVGHDGSVTYKRYLTDHSLLIEHYSSSGQLLSREENYLLKDHLGSIDVIMAADGTVQERLGFDAWGQRRLAATGAVLGSVLPSFASRTTRGYTGHEMVDSMGIIHMNGRINDPRLGRMLQADPFVQFAGNAQSYNRYSYVLNNPLKYNDPSGYFSLNPTKLAKKAVENFGIGGGSHLLITGDLLTASIANWTDSRIASNPNTSQLYITGVSVVSGIVCGPCSIGFTALASANMAYYQTGSFNAAFRQGAYAGISAAAFYAVGQTFNADTGFYQTGGLGHIGAHALVGGVMAELQGGKFGHGFFSAGITKAVTPAFTGVGNGAFTVGRVNLAGVAIAATLGGTISELTGGKFANGAMTAAFAYTLNEALSARQQHSEKERHQKGAGWLRPEGHKYVVGRDGHPIVWSGEQSPGIGSFIDDYLPAGHTFGTNHDAFVGLMVDQYGLPDLLINIPSMGPIYIFSVGQELVNTPFRAIDHLFDTNSVPFEHSH